MLNQTHKPPHIEIILYQLSGTSFDPAEVRGIAEVKIDGVQIDIKTLRSAVHSQNLTNDKLMACKLEFHGWTLEVISDTPFGAFGITNIDPEA